MGWEPRLSAATGRSPSPCGGDLIFMDVRSYLVEWVPDKVDEGTHGILHCFLSNTLWFSSQPLI